MLVAQEFWVGNEELVNLYEKRLGDAGYVNFKLGRTNNRGDGILFKTHFRFIKLLLGPNISCSPTNKLLNDSLF